MKRLLVALSLIACSASGCTPADAMAAREVIKPVIKVTCAVARRVAAACPLVEAATEATSGDEVP